MSPPRPDSPRGPRPVVRLGPFLATLPNGVFGDPLLHVRVAHDKRSLLIDFGEGTKLPGRIAHQVSDVLLTHAHADHITGFLPFVRSRIGEWPVCRVFGPRGISDNVAGLVAGIHWDRVGLRAPRFEVTELAGTKLTRFLVAAGQRAAEPLDETEARDGLLLDDGFLRIRAVELDHLTPVLAYALEPNATVRVRRERLERIGLEPGPWLTRLKRLVLAGEGTLPVELPNGESRPAATLAADLCLVQPAENLVYATDLADTDANRHRLVGLARGAHTLFLEAAFLSADVSHAARTGHLTTRGCGEIAVLAGVQRLVPFHFSRRYEMEPARVYAEIAAVCPATLIPPELCAKGHTRAREP